MQEGLKSGDVKAYEIETYFLICPRGFCRDRPVYFESVSDSGSENPVVALMALDAPALLWLAHGWYALMPGVAVFIGGTLFSGVWHVWFESVPRKKQGKGGLPPWPISDTDEKPAIVVGETHHPIEAREIPNPDWLVIPERGLYTGVAIFGAVGSG